MKNGRRGGRFAAGVLALALGAGCGYRFGTDYVVQELSVRMFDNQTERRHHERELTRHVVQEIRSAGIRVDPRAPTELQGEIVELSLPALAENDLDEVLVGAFSVTVRFRLVDRDTGHVRWERTATASDSFTDLRGKPVTAAQTEAFRRIGAAIVSHLETGW